MQTTRPDGITSHNGQAAGRATISGGGCSTDMLPFYSFSFLATVLFAIFFYRAGEFDGGPGLLWAGLSVAISLLVWRWLGLGWLGIILGQVGLFVGIGVFRVLRKS